MNHKEKVKLARKMQTRTEKAKYRPAGVYHGIFQSKAWEARRERIRVRVARQQGLAHLKAEERRGNKPSVLTRARRIVQSAIQRRKDARHARRARHEGKTNYQRKH